MTSNDYLKYSIKNELVKKLDWYFSVLSIKPSDNAYVKIVNTKYHANINGTWTLIEDSDSSRPLYSTGDTVSITSEELPNISSGSVTTYWGRVIANYLLICVPFNNFIPFIDDKFSVEDIEKKIVKSVQSGIIKVKEYLLFLDCVSFLQSLAPLVTISATPKNLVPPIGIKEFKEKLRKHLDKKYGPEWVKNQVYIAEYKKKLFEYDNEWLADDVTNNKIVSSKVKADGRGKMYLTFGAELGFDDKGENPILVDDSLDDGYKLDKTELTSIFNTARAGSYYRGKETQKGGAVAKDVLRATSSIDIIDKDCGSNICKEITVTEKVAEQLVGRYIRTGKGFEPIKDAKQYIGKTIEIRSPMYCKLPGKQFCTTCCGDNLKGFESGISLLSNEVAAVLLKAALKKVHSSVLPTVKFDFNETIKD